MLAVGGVVALVAASPWEPQPPLPPLLRGTTAGGGWGSACPPPKGISVTSPLALSPELSDRLAQKFPPGSSSDDLESWLLGMGFENLPPCEGDITIHVAVFRQHGGLYPMTAFAYWKIGICSTLVFPVFAGRFCGELAAGKMTIDLITGDSIQASGAPASRPQPTEPCREGRADPGAVSTA